MFHPLFILHSFLIFLINPQHKSRSVVYPILVKLWMSRLSGLVASGNFGTEFDSRILKLLGLDFPQFKKVLLAVQLAPPLLFGALADSRLIF